MSEPNHRPTLITRHQLRAGRFLAGLGVRELGELAQLSPTAINQIETGRTLNPHKSTAESLAKILISKGVDFGCGGWVRLHSDREHQGAAFMQGFPFTDANRMEMIRLLMDTVDILQGMGRDK